METNWQYRGTPFESKSAPSLWLVVVGPATCAGVSRSGLVVDQATPCESGMPAAFRYEMAIPWFPSAKIAILGAEMSALATVPLKGAVAVCTATNGVEWSVH